MQGRHIAQNNRGTIKLVLRGCR